MLILMTKYVSFTKPSLLNFDVKKTNNF